MMLAALDPVMVATALPTIAASLGDIDNMSWVVTANLLCATAATPLYGKLSDIHGRRTMMLIAITIYAGGSLACALAPSMLTLILARGLQGLGSGGLMPLVQTIIGDVASPRDRPRYQAYTSSTFIISTVGGPILGGFIAEHLHWSWIFWFNLPLCGLAFLLTHNVLQRLPRHDRRHRLDLLGALLMVGAAIALMLVLTWGGRRYAWDSPPILTAVVVVQNAVALHQLGVATGTMNFFRALGSTFIVSGFGAMVLAATPVARGLSAGAVLAGADAAEAFRWVFATAIVCLGLALASILALEERPLRGSARAAKRLD